MPVFLFRPEMRSLGSTDPWRSFRDYELLIYIRDICILRDVLISTENNMSLGMNMFLEIDTSQGLTHACLQDPQKWPPLLSEGGRCCLVPCQLGA